MYLLDPEPGLEEKVLGLRNQLQKKKKKKRNQLQEECYSEQEVWCRR